MKVVTVPSLVPPIAQVHPTFLGEMIRTLM
jgi:hypothetical protein